jgi:hypothetical protein
MFSKCCASDSNYYILYHQAAAYYYHGLILDKGNEPSFHVSAVCCFLAAEQLLSESKKACLSFSLAAPVTRLGLIIIYCTHIILEFFFFFAQSSFFVFFCFWARAPPLWGSMKHLHQKIPEVASRKSQMYGYLLEQEK